MLFNPLEKILDLGHVGVIHLRVLGLSGNRGIILAARQRRGEVFCIKLETPPTRKAGRGAILDVFYPPTLFQLKAASPYFTRILQIWKRFQMEEIAEEIPVGLDPQECFAEMNKDRNVKNGVWGQMLDLNPIEIKESAKEIGGGQSKTSLHEMRENDGFPRFF